MRRLPFAALTEALGPIYNPNLTNNQYKKVGSRVEWVECNGNPTGVLSELTGIHKRVLTRWTRDGIPEDRADAIAVALGLHVSLIWPCWFQEVSV